ncbi:MAG: BatA domain-containing protein [Rhizobacter sp.]|nr:BatA domain-containing protein [Rhizobacter sp.]
MTFIWPEMLWGLLAVPLLIALYVWLLRRRKKTALRYASLSLVKEAMGKHLAWRRHLPPALMLAGVTALLVAAGRPGGVISLPSAEKNNVVAMDG